MISGECPECHGTRLNARSGAVRVSTGASAALTFPQFLALDVGAAHVVALDLVATRGESDALREVVTGIERRLHFLVETGLGYLTLDRDYATVSGGEAQRIRLATQLGMGLIGVIYVLDEPSIGLHPHDNERLLGQLRALRDRGNTVVVVEHDEDTLRAADEIIELGPGAGVEGGELLFQGTPAACAAQSAKLSRTGPYLARQIGVLKDAATKKPDGTWLTVREAREHNLRGIDVRFPAGLLTCVTGVSGSGKSTLVNDVLAAAAARKLNGAKLLPGRHRHIENLDLFEKLVLVDQEPIGRSPALESRDLCRACSNHLRDLFAQRAARQSPRLQGAALFVQRARRPLRALPGRRRHQARHAIHGRRLCALSQLRRPALQPRDPGNPLPRQVHRRCARHDRAQEAIALFRNIPACPGQAGSTLEAVGLGYLTLGQSAVTLSGGEAQRLKLSLELSKKQQGQTLYILDEPTTGLHWVDIQRLMDLLFKLRDAGNTIIVIEHNLDVIHLADWIVDLGPGGGSAGGDLVYAGDRGGIEAVSRSLTGQALARWRQAGAVLVAEKRKLS